MVMESFSNAKVQLFFLRHQDVARNKFLKNVN